MNPIDNGHDVPAETTEQALARVEAECGWSDLSRFADAFAAPQATTSSQDDRAQG
ncbi:MAG: hypothetical protein WCK28_10995 [Burkholderiales bacterium]|jgi:hypothetical protein